MQSCGVAELQSCGVVFMTKWFSGVLIAVILLVPIAATAQKGSFGEIKQLQSPQNPALGFMIHGGAGVLPKRK